jgi:hypothetical protein
VAEGLTTLLDDARDATSATLIASPQQQQSQQSGRRERCARACAGARFPGRCRQRCVDAAAPAPAPPPPAMGMLEALQSLVVRSPHLRPHGIYPIYAVTVYGIDCPQRFRTRIMRLTVHRHA